MFVCDSQPADGTAGIALLVDEPFSEKHMRIARIGIAALVSVCLVGCASQPLSRSEAQAALINLAESKGTPLALTVPGLRSGNIRYVTGKEEGISPGIWDVDLSKKTFLFLAANDRSFHSYGGVFRKVRDEWKAEITEENSSHGLPNH
jgi:hypothetical protein